MDANFSSACFIDLPRVFIISALSSQHTHYAYALIRACIVYTYIGCVNDALFNAAPNV